MPWTHRAFWIAPLIIALILSLLVAIVRNTWLRAIYRERIAQSPRERSFLASVGFFIAILVVRGLTIAIHNNIGPFHNVEMRGRHIHHLVWGILLLLLVGYGWLLEIGTGQSRSFRWLGRLMSTLYGVAAALTLDEFALWLNLRDVYWEREGRASFEALGLFGALLSTGLFGRRFFSGIGKEIKRTFHRRERNGPRS